MIPYGRQSIDEDDIRAVTEVLRSDFLTCGPKVEEFEKAFADYCGARHAVACANGTAALHLAMLAAEIGPGDRVVTTPNTFLASANCAAFVGATPDFADIDPVSYCLSPAALEAGWQEDTRAIVAVDYAGQRADMPEIARIARNHDAIVIEDACHGIGGGFVHQEETWKLGGHPWADITTFSFHPVKTMTTGEGGILVTDNDAYAHSARLLRNHGMVRDGEHFRGLGGKPGETEFGPWYYEMQELGYNCRITDLQCALGLSQLAKLPRFIERRREIVARYNAEFADVAWLKTPGLRFPEDREHISWHLYTVMIDFPALGRSRAEVMSALRDKGVGSQVLYIPVHLQPWYRERYGYGRGKCPEAERLYENSLSLPLFPAMTDDDVAAVIEAVGSLAAR